MHSINLQFFKKIAGKPSKPGAALARSSSMQLIMSSWSNKTSDNKTSTTSEFNLDMSTGLLKTLENCLERASAISSGLLIKEPFSSFKGPT